MRELENCDKNLAERGLWGDTTFAPLKFGEIGKARFADSSKDERSKSGSNWTKTRFSENFVNSRGRIDKDETE